MGIVTRLNRAIRCFATERVPDIEREEVSGKWVGEQLNPVLAGFDGVTRQPLDSTYWTASKSDWRTLIEAIPTNWMVWSRGLHDCEDYAWELRHIAVNYAGLTTVGLVNDFSAAHAYNVLVTVNGDVFFVEPDPQPWGFRRPEEFPVDDRHKLETGSILL